MQQQNRQKVPETPAIPDSWDVLADPSADDPNEPARAAAIPFRSMPRRAQEIRARHTRALRILHAHSGALSRCADLLNNRAPGR